MRTRHRSCADHESGTRPCGTRSSTREARSRAPPTSSGTNKVSMIDANTSENAVHSTTRMKISHTWLASHTGPMEWSMTARGRSPRARATGDQVPEPGAEVGPAEQGVGGDAEEQDHGDGVAPTHPTGTSSWTLRRRRRRPVGNVGLVTLARLAPAAAHAPQHEDRGHADHRGRGPTTTEERDPHACCCRSRPPRRACSCRRSTVGARPRSRPNRPPSQTTARTPVHGGDA